MEILLCNKVLRNFSVPQTAASSSLERLCAKFRTRKISHNFHLLMINIHLSWSRSEHTHTATKGWWMKAWKFSMEFYLLWLNENKLDFLMIHSQCTNSSFFAPSTKNSHFTFFSISWKLQSLFLIKSFLMRNHLSTYTTFQLGFVSAKFMRQLLKRNALDCVTSGYEF